MEPIVKRFCESAFDQFFRRREFGPRLYSSFFAFIRVYSFLCFCRNNSFFSCLSWLRILSPRESYLPQRKMRYITFPFLRVFCEFKVGWFRVCSIVDVESFAIRGSCLPHPRERTCDDTYRFELLETVIIILSDLLRVVIVASKLYDP